MGWSLAQVREIDADEYEELKTWLNEEAERAKHGDDEDGDIDMDAVIDAKAAKDEREESD
jgi:hypothetical protein